MSESKNFTPVIELSNIKVPNPFTAVKKIYSNAVEDNTVRTHFSQRNESKVTIPFLDSLLVPYIVVSNIVLLVKNDDTVISKLESLGFIATKDFLPKKVYYVKHLKETEALHCRRLYQSEYNIELHIVEPHKWDLVKAAQSITNDITASEEQYLQTYLKVYASIARLKVFCN